MDNREETRAFLTSRRTRITPDQAGIPSYGGIRRVAGLRRSEVAMLAGVSAEYYTKLERGNLGGVSESVLDALCRALQLDETERAHLYELARAASTSAATARSRRRPAPAGVRASVRNLLAAMTATPAIVRDNRFDILAANDLGRALYAPIFAGATGGPANTIRFCFLDPAATGFYRDWEKIARDSVGALRVAAAKDPYDLRLSGMIGELSTRSDQFRVWWGAQDVYVHRSGTKRFHHPVIGDLSLDHESLTLPGDTGLTMVAYSTEPGSPDEDALKMLASWAATAEAAH